MSDLEHPEVKLDTLRTRREVDELFRKGVRLRGRLVGVTVLRRPDQQARGLFVTTRKLGKAVVRNKVRRRMRETYRSLSGELRSADVALVAYPVAARASFGALRDDITALLRKAGLLGPSDAQGERLQSRSEAAQQRHQG
jgi:ribonuclease P protein component